MKSMHGLVRKFSFLIAALILTGSAFSLHAEKTSDGEATVLRITGAARYTADNQTWKALKKGENLKPGMVIQTAPNSIVDLRINEAHPSRSKDGTEATTDHLIRIFENSALKINKLVKKKDGSDVSQDIEFELRAGEMMGTVGRLYPASEYEIKLPHAIVGIREGTYMASSSGALNVFRGSAALVKINADGSMTTKKLGASQGFDPETGAVVAISVPPGFDSWEGDLPKTATTAPTPASGVPHGSGMGGSLRKF
jgi:hypothetical protein